MNWDLEEILRISEKDAEREADKTQIIDLSARIEKIQAILNKPDLGQPTLIGSEVTPRRQKLSAFLRILIATRDRKEKERYEASKKEKEKWRDEALKENLHDLRCAYGTSVDHLLHGVFTLEIPDWFKPDSTEFEIDAVSGHKLKIDLKKLITPSTLQMLLSKSFSPIYLVVEAAGGYDRHGKPLGYFQSGDWETSHGNEIRAGTTFAIMRV